MKGKQYDRVFSVLLSVCITINNLRNEDVAKSECFCDVTLSQTRGCGCHHIFMTGMSAPKKVVNLCPRSAMSNPWPTCGPLEGFRCSKSILHSDNLSFFISLNLTFCMQVVLSAFSSCLDHCS